MTFNGAFGAYGYNANGGNAIQIPLGRIYKILPLGGNGGGQPVSESEVVAPSQMIAIGDSQTVLVPNIDALLGSDRAPEYPVVGLVYPQIWRGPLPAWANAMRIRHGGRWNEVFCDGHSEHGRVATFFDFDNDEVLKRWNRDNIAHREWP